eukprot:7824097-Pyramimonas_sp.AAC.1
MHRQHKHPGDVHLRSSEECKLECPQANTNCCIKWLSQPTETFETCCVTGSGGSGNIVPGYRCEWGYWNHCTMGYCCSRAGKCIPC